MGGGIWGAGLEDRLAGTHRLASPSPQRDLKVRKRLTPVASQVISPNHTWKGSCCRMPSGPAQEGALCLPPPHPSGLPGKRRGLALVKLGMGNPSRPVPAQTSQAALPACLLMPISEGSRAAHLPRTTWTSQPASLPHVRLWGQGESLCPLHLQHPAAFPIRALFPPLPQPGRFASCAGHNWTRNGQSAALAPWKAGAVVCWLVRHGPGRPHGLKVWREAQIPPPGGTRHPLILSSVAPSGIRLRLCSAMQSGPEFLRSGVTGKRA